MGIDHHELLVIVKGEGPSLFGRNWLERIILDWKEINYLRSSSLQTILEKHEAVFQDGLGTLQGFEAKLNCRGSRCSTKVLQV